MGYTHYWYRIQDLDRELFKKVCLDFRKIEPVFKHTGFQLGNGFGEDIPTISFEEIAFNGLRECGHPKQYVGLAWPKQDAKGVSIMKKGERASSIDGKWFAGNMLSERVCDGDCSYETFRLERFVNRTQPEYKEDKDDPFFFDCTKTNYRPYDLAVQVCLIIASHHLGQQIRVTSDGESQHWEDARQMCQQFLGYGKDFELYDEEKPPMEVSN